MAVTNYIVLGCKPWNRRVFDDVIRHFPDEWTYVGRRDELTPERLARRAPRYLFFLHWSWAVPVEIVCHPLVSTQNYDGDQQEKQPHFEFTFVHQRVGQQQK